MSHRVQKANPSDDLMEIVVTGYRRPLQSAPAISVQPAEPLSIHRSGGKGTQMLDGSNNNLITLNGEVLLTGREIDAWRSTPRWE